MFFCLTFTQYTENGKWMDGWESARHGNLKRGGRDFCLIALGVPGKIVGVDIDTLHFTGNYAEYASIEACCVSGAMPWWRLLEADVKWCALPLHICRDADCMPHLTGLAVHSGPRSFRA